MSSNVVVVAAACRQLYEPHAFLLDQERSSMLPVMAAGLSSIIFSIAVDAAYLSSLSRSVDISVGTDSSRTTPLPHDDHLSYLSFSAPGKPHTTTLTTVHTAGNGRELGPSVPEPFVNLMSAIATAPRMCVCWWVYVCWGVCVGVCVCVR